jgi:F-type H+-transporting ATPase subunit a
LEISIAPEKVFSLGNFVVTNAVLSAVIIISLLSLSIVLLSFNIKAFKASKIQIFFELVIDGIRDISNSIIGQKGKALFPFLFTFFLFVVLSNWFGLLPFVGPISVLHTEDQISNSKFQNESGVDFWSCLSKRDCYLNSKFEIVQTEEAFPLFRAPTSDVSATLALALISVLATNVLGFHFTGFKYIKKYLDFSNPINFFIGLLEIVSEFAKIISFTFRLFGNIFAGEVLLLVITSLTFGLATLPFMALELFVGFIQGFVFFMLTAVFISMALKH